jgi:hypothetical protein
MSPWRKWLKKISVACPMKVCAGCVVKKAKCENCINVSSRMLCSLSYHLHSVASFWIWLMMWITPKNPEETVCSFKNTFFSASVFSEAGCDYLDRLRGAAFSEFMIGYRIEILCHCFNVGLTYGIAKFLTDQLILCTENCHNNNKIKMQIIWSLLWLRVKFTKREFGHLS